ncbi:hypothetical protein SNE40_005935 [Patella caerulea]|uniref:Ankyrin repeat protein n=1 Tax=Patella caerulea TaxID=87958 RepID=A0AAN8K8K1_PATCE
MYLNSYISDNTTLLTPGHHSPNLESCLQSSQHQDLESGQPSTSSSLDSGPINQRKDDTTPVKTSPVYDDDTTPVRTSPVYDDDKVVRPNKYTLFNVCEDGTLDELKSILSDKTIDINNTDYYIRTAMYYCIISSIQPVKKVEVMISSGAKLNVKDGFGNSLLHVACEDGCVETVKLLLNTGRVDIESRNVFDTTPIFKAIRSDKQPVKKLDFLISSGAKLDVKDRNGNSLFHVACEYGCVETVDLLLNTGRVDIESKNSDDKTPIFKAIGSDKQPVEKLGLLISSGAKLDVKDRRSDSLLHVACKYGRVETVEWLLNTGRVDIESKNNDDNTPILVAIRSGKQPLEKMRVLANCGANVDVKYGDGNSLLHEACGYCGVETVELLLNTGRVDIESKNNDCNTPILVAIRSDKQPVEKMRVLANCGANVDVKYGDGNSLLHEACGYCGVESVELLLNTGRVDIESKNIDCNTPILVAIRSDKKPVAKMRVLANCGANLNVKYGDGNSLLHVACGDGCVETVKLLLNTDRVDIESKNSDGYTPIISALLSSTQPIQKTELLLDKGAKLDHSSSILHYACQYGSLGCVKYFIKKKLFNIESRDGNNRTPLFSCVLTKRIQFKKKIDLLMSMNVNNLVRDMNNLSVLQFARQHARKTRVQYLIEKGFTD